MHILQMKELNNLESNVVEGKVGGYTKIFVLSKEDNTIYTNEMAMRATMCALPKLVKNEVEILVTDFDFIDTDIYKYCHEQNNIYVHQTDSIEDLPKHKNIPPITFSLIVKPELKETHINICVDSINVLDDNSNIYGGIHYKTINKIIDCSMSSLGFIISDPKTEVLAYIDDEGLFVENNPVLSYQVRGYEHNLPGTLFIQTLMNGYDFPFIEGYDNDKLEEIEEIINSMKLIGLARG